MFEKLGVGRVKWEIEIHLQSSVKKERKHRTKKQQGKFDLETYLDRKNFYFHFSFTLECFGNIFLHVL